MAECFDKDAQEQIADMLSASAYAVALSILDGEKPELPDDIAQQLESFDLIRCAEGTRYEATDFLRLMREALEGE